MRSERWQGVTMKVINQFHQDSLNQKRKAKVVEQRATQQKKRAKEEEATAAASAQVRKKRYVRMGMEEKRNAKRAKTSSGDD